jgi:hypothetical protein
MPVALYMDQHVPGPITRQLRRRGVDVLTALEDGHDRTPDDELLEHIAAIGRVLFTHDIRFEALAESWQRQGKPFAGLIFAHPLRGTIGQLVRDLELIAKATDPVDWLNKVERLPYRVIP